jgi:hypothetical protein
MDEGRLDRPIDLNEIHEFARSLEKRLSDIGLLFQIDEPVSDYFINFAERYMEIDFGSRRFGSRLRIYFGAQMNYAFIERDDVRSSTKSQDVELESFCRFLGLNIQMVKAAIIVRDNAKHDEN